MTASWLLALRSQRWLFVVSLLAVLVCADVAAGPKVAIELTAAERDWLESHGPVRVVVSPPNRLHEPFYFADPATQGPGQPVVRRGFAMAVMELLAERAGLQMELIAAETVAQGLELLRSGQADMTPLLRLTPARSEFLSMPGTILPVDVVWVTRPDVGLLTPIRDLGSLRLVVQTSSVADDELTAMLPGAQILRLPSVGQALQAVAEGRADALLSENYSTLYAIEELGLQGLQIRRPGGLARDVFGPLVSLRLPHLHSILAKALQTLVPAERSLLLRRWLPSGAGLDYSIETASLSAADRAWVAGQGELRIGYDADLAPFTMNAGPGGFDGLGADLIRAVAQKSGLRLVRHVGASAAEVQQQALSGALNVVVGLQRSAQSSQDFFHIGPFAQVPAVLVMRADDRRQFSDTLDLGEGRLSLLQSDFLLTQLRARQPRLQVLELPSLSAVLQAVVEGRADAALGNGHAINRLIDERHAGRLRVSGVVADAESGLYLGVPRSQPELSRVLELGFAALTPSELAALRQRWLLVRIQPGLRWDEVMRWVVPAAVVLLTALLLLLLANRRLAAAKVLAEAALAQAEAAASARGRFLAYLAHEVRGLVHAIGWGAHMMLAKEPQAAPEQVAGWIQAAAEQTGSLLESTLDNERAMAHGMQLSPQPHELEPWWHQALAPHLLLAARKSLPLHHSAPQARQALGFDAQRLSQVLNNLVGNAIRYTERGEVEVHGQWDAAQGRLHIQVQDTGPGIAAADQGLLWEPYAQGEAGRSAGEGAGLGLAITRAIVQAMKGSIELSARAGGGTCVRVSVPLMPLQPEVALRPVAGPATAVSWENRA